MKNFILDTSVMLYDKNAIQKFKGGKIIIPLVVLDELDRFKEREGLLGEAARYVNRFLDEVRKEGNLSEGVYSKKYDQIIKVELSSNIIQQVPPGLDSSKGDNKIIATALHFKLNNPEEDLILITKDINMRVKCDSLGIKTEDYLADYEDIDGKEWNGWRSVEFLENEVNLFYKDKYIKTTENLCPNEFIVGSGSPQGSFLGIFKDGKIKALESETRGIVQVTPKGKEQEFAMHALLDPNIPLVTLTGLAGSGKTFLALMAGLNSLYEKKHSRLIITRTIQPVGKDLGYLPGDLNEKMQPWLAPIFDNVRHAFNDVSYFESMIKKGEIDIAPIPYIRGRTFNDAFLIVDEAQNATIHELKTIITRVGKNTKIVLLGDTDQIDTPYINKRSNGLTIVRERFRKSTYSAHVHLAKGQRSGLATEASNIL